LYKITNPELCERGIDFYNNKLELSKHPNTKSYYKNGMKRLFGFAEQFVHYLNPDDERYLNLSKSELEDLLKTKKQEYKLN
jgi:hypothetical protein